jgi:hypothetical protein
MAAVPVTIVGIQTDDSGESKNVTIIGMASITGLGVGGGPIFPPTPPPHPEHPIVIPDPPPIQPPDNPGPPISIVVKPPPPNGGWAWFAPYGWGYFPPPGAAGPKR